MNQKGKRAMAVLIDLSLLMGGLPACRNTPPADPAVISGGTTTHQDPDAPKVIESKELTEFSAGEPVVTVLNGSRESRIVAEILRRALGERAMILRMDEDGGEDLLCRIASAYRFWEDFTKEHGRLPYCFALCAEDSEEWDYVQKAACGGPDAAPGGLPGEGLFSRSFSALCGVSEKELGLVEQALR